MVLTSKQKRRLQLQKELEELEKQHKVARLQETILQKKCIAVKSEQAQLENQAEEPLVVAESNPFIEALSSYLVTSLIGLCQSYNTFEICPFCNMYHLRGFCPQECLSLERKYVMKHTFSSCISTCEGRKACNYSRLDSVFRDESDNVLWQWIMDSIAKAFPTRVYKTAWHKLSDHGNLTSNMQMEISTMWTNNKVPQPRVFPPTIKLSFTNGNLSGHHHIGFENCVKLCTKKNCTFIEQKL
jgi:hypothetical protein